MVMGRGAARNADIIKRRGIQRSALRTIANGPRQQASSCTSTIGPAHDLADSAPWRCPRRSATGPSQLCGTGGGRSARRSADPALGFRTWSPKGRAAPPSSITTRSTCLPADRRTGCKRRRTGDLGQWAADTEFYTLPAPRVMTLDFVRARPAVPTDSHVRAGGSV